MYFILHHSKLISSLVFQIIPTKLYRLHLTIISFRGGLACWIGPRIYITGPPIMTSSLKGFKLINLFHGV